MLFCRSSRDVMLEAMQWLIKLHTSNDQELDAVWLELDAWLESSERNRLAFEKVRAQWLTLDGLPPDPPLKIRATHRRWNGDVNRWRSDLDPADVLAALMITAALALAFCVTHVL